MARLIDADSLIERLKFKRRLNGNIPDKCAGYDSAIAQANKLPSVDPVHVAGACYCRECKHWQEHYDYCKEFAEERNQGGFCSCGEKRNVDENTHSSV